MVNFKVQEHHRVSRQANSDRSQIIDNIFQVIFLKSFFLLDYHHYYMFLFLKIPIQTLLAVNNLVQSSRGFLRRQSQPQQPQVSAQRSSAADLAGVRKQTDGSNYRI